MAGSDLFPSLHLWENGEQLKRDFFFVIFKREGAKELDPEDYPEKYILFETNQVKGMSSSEMRTVLKKTESWDKHERTSQILSPATIAYIKDNPTLYKQMSN